MREPLRISLILAAAMLLISCHGARTGASSQTAVPSPAHSGAYAFQGGRAMSFALHAASFANRAAIPARYTCDGAGLSPGLSWTGVPAGAQSLALIADDPDAPMGTWNHWVIWNIPASATQLPEGVPAVVLLDDGTRQGLNRLRANPIATFSGCMLSMRNSM
jgi:Raf kinase inhibitor-like YbhB/YbcL family protein